jgi:hypothetical protein
MTTAPTRVPTARTGLLGASALLLILVISILPL